LSKQFLLETSVGYAVFYWTPFWLVSNRIVAIERALVVSFPKNRRSVFMLRIKQLSLAFVGLLSCLSSLDVTYAQGGGGGRGQGPGRGQQTRTRFELATLPEVQSELKLTEEQKKLAGEQLAKLREKQAAMAPGGGGGGGGAGGGAAMQAARAEMQKMSAELDMAFSAKLDDAQTSRMHGLIAQVNGAAALMDAAIAKALEISEEQSTKLKAANDANQAARREAMQGAQDMSQEERAAAMTKLATEQTKTLMAVLTEAQMKKLETLKGAALTIDMAPLRPARRQ
jgi:hypothetical protein